jgi:DNA-binding transcriptional LysR family regulator
VKNIAAVDLNLLKVFDALLSERRVKLAAARIGISQPALSNALNRLRHLFDDRLFIRTPEGMQPTARARALAGPIQRAMKEIQGAFADAQEFDPATSERTLTVGITDFSVVGLTLGLPERIQALAPNAQLQVRYVSGRDAAALLDGEEIDVVVGVQLAPRPRFETRFLFEERAMFLMRHGHPAARRFSLERLLAFPHLLVSPLGTVVGTIDPALAELGVARRIAVIVPDLVAVPSLLQSSDLITAVAGRTAERLARLGGLQALPAPLQLPVWNVIMMWHARDNAEPAKAWLRELIVELARELDGSGRAAPQRRRALRGSGRNA